jgi:hypothetical protein
MAADVMLSHILLPQQAGMLLISSTPFLPDIPAVVAAGAAECTQEVLDRLAVAAGAPQRTSSQTTTGPASPTSGSQRRTSGS